MWYHEYIHSFCKGDAFMHILKNEHRHFFSKKTRLVCCAALLGFVLAAAGCGGSASSSSSSAGTSQAAAETGQVKEPLTGADLLMQSTLLLPGDSVPIRFKTEDFTYSYAKDLRYDVSDPDVAVISYDKNCESFVVTAKAPGTAAIIGNLNGTGGSLDITVAEVDSASGVTLTPSEAAIDLGSGKASVSLALEGQVPEHYVAKYYASPMLMIAVDGAWDGQTLNLTVSEAISYGDGYLTVLVTDKDAATVLASARIDIKVK